MQIEFKPWPKTPRLYRPVTITEKIDGTNAAVQILRLDVEDIEYDEEFYCQTGDGAEYIVVPQSRKRVLTLGQDNAGFARWVSVNQIHLVETLGPGCHFGEWWGHGIQRGYSNKRKMFSLFNTAKWYDTLSVYGDETGLGRVPVLYEGPFSELEIQECLDDLRMNGSVAAPGYDQPEGICIYHTASNSIYKVLLESDELHKGEL